MTKQYKNKAHRFFHDYNWDGMDDGYEYTEPHKKLRRNKIDGVFGGVCAGLGDYVGIDAIIIRIIFILLVIFTAFPLIVYFILWICIPADNRAPYVRQSRESRKARKRRRRQEALEDEMPLSTVNFRDVKSKYRSLETRLQDLERSITSKEWQLRRQFRDLEQ